MSTLYAQSAFMYMLVNHDSFKKPFLAVNTGSRLLLLVCFLMLGAGGRTLPHLSVVVLCLFPWPKSCRGVVVYMLGWLVMTHDDDTILFSSFLYYLFATNRNKKYDKVPQSIITF